MEEEFTITPVYIYLFNKGWHIEEVTFFLSLMFLVATSALSFDFLLFITIGYPYIDYSLLFSN